MKFLLDTNICIHFLNRRNESLIKRLNEINQDDIVVCSMVKAELAYGALKSKRPVETLTFSTGRYGLRMKH